MSKGHNRTIVVYKNPTLGATPGLVLLGHRQLEKEAALPLAEGSQSATYVIPADLLNLATDMESSDVSIIQFTYEKRRTT